MTFDKDNVIVNREQVGVSESTSGDAASAVVEAKSVRDTTITIEGNATVKPSCKISSDKMVYEREFLKGNGDGNYHMGEVGTIKADSAG